MMQIGGIDSQVLKQVKLPAEENGEDKKILQQDEDIRAGETVSQAQEEEKEEKDEEAANAVYGNVVGRSSDGDTTRVREDAKEALETGMVFQKEEKENNLMEFNRDQLTIMNEKGDITDNQYNHEITRRDELMEKDEKSAFAKTNAEMIEKQEEEAKEKAQEKAKERFDEIQGNGKENAATEEEQKLENGMNTLAASTGRLEIEEEAVEDAAAAGRSEIIDQILNPEDGIMKVVIR